jgi:hypothetical protein
MSVLSNDDTTYRIETTVSSGHITDPVTGERHEVEGGEIEVPRPDSAQYLVDGNGGLEFVGNPPTDNAVREAQREAMDFEATDLCVAFADKRNDTVGGQSFNPADGFDPKTDAPTNGPRIKARNAYADLLDAGMDDEAAYLRALTKIERQEQFVKFLQERGAL